MTNVSSIPQRSGRCGTARVAVLSIVDVEFAASNHALNTSFNIPRTPYYVRELKDLQRIDVVHRQADAQGNHPAGDAIGGLIEDFRPHYLLLVGVAGGVQDREGTQLGDVVTADFIEYSDFRKLINGSVRPTRIPYDHPSLFLRESIAEPLMRDGKWADEITEIPPSPLMRLPHAIKGNLVASDTLWSDPNNLEQQYHRETYGKCIAFEMESFGVAHKIYSHRRECAYNPQYLVIRGISDFLNETPDENNETRKQWRKYAAHSAAVFAKKVVDAILQIPE